MYLENNCGFPVDLTCFPDLENDFKKRLTRYPEQYKRLSQIGEPSVVKIIIQDDWYKNFGCFMSHKNMYLFNMMVERKLKALMREYISYSCSHGYSIASGIRQFQNEFGFSEFSWCFETIKKDYSRHCEKISIKRSRHSIGTNNIFDWDPAGKFFTDF